MSSGLLARPKWMNQEVQEVYDSINKNIKDGDELIKDLLDICKNNTDDIKEKTPEKIEEEMYNKDVKNMIDELNKNIRIINKSLLLIADVLKERGIK